MPYYNPNKQQMHSSDCCGEVRDFGKQPCTLPLCKETLQNRTFRTAFWTGEHMQVMLMCLGTGEDIGAETHSCTDQMLYIAAGRGTVQFGTGECAERRNVMPGDAVFVPAGTRHNLQNTGSSPLKLFSVYAPVQHPFGTIHKTKADAIKQGD
ncbi:MAG: cupin domain-containing protein [Candidatus Fimenecus sp.]